MRRGRSTNLLFLGSVLALALATGCGPQPQSAIRVMADGVYIDSVQLTALFSPQAGDSSVWIPLDDRSFEHRLHVEEPTFIRVQPNTRLDPVVLVVAPFEEITLRFIPGGVTVDGSQESKHFAALQRHFLQFRDSSARLAKIYHLSQSDSLRRWLVSQHQHLREALVATTEAYLTAHPFSKSSAFALTAHLSDSLPIFPLRTHRARYELLVRRQAECYRELQHLEPILHALSLGYHPPRPAPAPTEDTVPASQPMPKPAIPKPAESQAPPVAPIRPSPHVAPPPADSTQPARSLPGDSDSISTQPVPPDTPTPETPPEHA